MTNDNLRKPRFSVGLPAIRASVTMVAVTPPDGPITTGPWIHVRHPLVRKTLTKVPVSPVSAEIEMPLSPGGEDGERLLETLHSLVGKVNECEALFGRPGLMVNGERSGLRAGKVVIVLGPNDPVGAIETCKRIADQLFAAVRTIPGVTVKVLSTEHPEKPICEFAA